jgi:HEAT repeat protein
MESARVIGVRKDRRAVPRMLQAVAEGGASQAFHIQMLGEIGDPRAFEPLQELLATPQFMLGQQVVTALRKIDNARAVDLFHEQLEELPAREGDRLARTLAGTDLLNAALSLVRKARASGDTATLSQAFGAAQAALHEHRARLEAIQKGESPADTGDGAEDLGEGADADPSRAVSKAGLDVIRKFESILRDLGRGG